MQTVTAIIRGEIVALYRDADGQLVNATLLWWWTQNRKRVGSWIEGEPYTQQGRLHGHFYKVARVVADNMAQAEG